MNGRAPPVVDPRAVLIVRAAALNTLLRAGEITLDDAFDELVRPFLDIVGLAPAGCEICRDPPWRHDGAWCAACREAEERRQRDAAKPRPRPPTPRTTIEAIMYCVRQRGPIALKDAANLERLSRCDDAARAEINDRVAALSARKSAA
jgi:hypothetical protein